MSHSVNAIEKSNVIPFTNNKFSADHELCRTCEHDLSCTRLCIAISVLVQLAKEKSPMTQLENVYNIGTQLDLTK